MSPMTMRDRMLEVLHADPLRCRLDERPTDELIGLLCGDLLQARANERHKADESLVRLAMMAATIAAGVEANPENDAAKWGEPEQVAGRSIAIARAIIEALR